MWKSIVLSLLLVAPGVGAISNEELLDAGEAFPARIAAVRRDAIEVTFKIAEGYYLYRDKLHFAVASDAAHLGTPVLPKGKIKKDEFFGKVEIYRGALKIKLPLADAPAGTRFMLTVHSQGCADIGVCYPPFEQSLTVELPAA